MKVACILEQSDYKPGDLPPEGYLAWHEWAEAQRKAGIKQVQCGKCGLWKTPQELSDQVINWTAQSRKGPVQMEAPVCLKCAGDEAKKEDQAMDRGSGRTTRQMQEAPQGAVFVSCNRNSMDYDRALARHLGREDLRIVTPYWLEEESRLRGHPVPAVVVDHAARLNDRQWVGLRYIEELMRLSARKPAAGVAPSGR